MCGICGILNRNDQPIDQSILSKMNDSIIHRGPDDRGHYIAGNVGLAMRRLSIIDVQGGKQPIHNEDNTVWVVYNGEIYNYIDLKKELQKKGHTFYTCCDTEVLVHLYEEYGQDFVSRLRGMFAFALWDVNQQQLILARDRIGIKPLYYYLDSQKFIFGSELKCIMNHPGISREIDLQAMDLYFSLLYVPSPFSIYQNVKKLHPAHMAILKDNDLSIRKYWDVSYPFTKKKTNIQELQEEFLIKFHEAVKIRLMSEVPLGALLSGGIDSSAMVAVMSRFSNRPVKTFTIGYGKNEKYFDESAQARRFSKIFSTEHHEETMRPKVISIVPEIIRYFDEPFADSSAIANYYVNRLARQDVTVALSGLGGDEIGAGYHRYLALKLASLYNKIPDSIKARWIPAIVNNLPDSKKGYRHFDRMKRFINSSNGSLKEKYNDFINYSPDCKTHDFYLIHVRNQLNAHNLQNFLKSYDKDGSIDALQYALHLDLHVYLPDDLLTLTDRMSMAHSLEVRVPYLDHELVEFMATVPSEFKLKGFTLKYFLKQAFKSILPAEIFKRPKKGFSIPLAMWFRHELKSYVCDTLSHDFIKKQGLFNYSQIEKVLYEHFSYSSNYHSQIWALLIFTEWYKENFSK